MRAQAAILGVLLVAVVSTAEAKDPLVGQAWKLTKSWGDRAYSGGTLHVTRSKTDKVLDCVLTAKDTDGRVGVSVVGTVPVNGPTVATAYGRVSWAGQPYVLKTRVARGAKGAIENAASAAGTTHTLEVLSTTTARWTWTDADGKTGKALFTRQKPVELVIVHTGNMHGYVRSDPKSGTGGWQVLAQFVREQRARAKKRGAGFLLLDAGDAWHGTPEGNFQGGAAVVALMNNVGYDAMVVGNHEFNHGVGTLAGLAEQAGFPFLAANVTVEKSGKTPGWAKARKMFQVDGLPVAVVGITTMFVPRFTQLGKAKGLMFESPVLFNGLEPIGAAPRAIAAARSAGAKAVILLSHAGRARDRELSTLGVQAVIGASSGRGFEQATGGAPISNTKTNLQVVGRLTLRLERETGALLGTQRLYLNVQKLKGDDAPTRARLSLLKKALPTNLDEPLGPRPSGTEDRPGTARWIAQQMRLTTGAELGIINRYGVRATLPPVVTRRALFEVSPYENTVVVLTLTGRQITDMVLDRRLKTLYASGHRSRYGQPPLISGRMLKEADTYTVATNAYVASHLLKRYRGEKLPIKDTGIDMSELLLRSFTEKTATAK